MEIPMNAQVECADGYAGHSVCVIINPVNERVTHLVVTEGGLLTPQHLMLIELILDTSHEAIRLKCTRSELQKLELFTETEFLPGSNDDAFLWPYFANLDPGIVVVEHECIPVDELAIRRGDAVYAQDGRIGRVDEFLIDAKSDVVSHLVMRVGHLWGHKDVTIPVDKIQRFEAHTVYLRFTRKQVEQLPTVTVKR
jgi:uncharacterized protein YrrD